MKHIIGFFLFISICLHIIWFNKFIRYSTQNINVFHHSKLHRIKAGPSPKTVLNLTYHYSKNDQKMYGRPFSQSSIDLLRLRFGDLVTEEHFDQVALKSRPIFLTAFSENHFGEAMIMLRKLFAVYNCWTKLVLYDLGLKYWLYL